MVSIAALIAVGVDAEGRREVLGLEAATSEDGAGGLAFFQYRPSVGGTATGESTPGEDTQGSQLRELAGTPMGQNQLPPHHGRKRRAGGGRA